jgi:hypothetical protein
MKTMSSTHDAASITDAQRNDYLEEVEQDVENLKTLGSSKHRNSDFQYFADTAFSTGTKVTRPGELSRSTLGNIIMAIRSGFVEGQDIKPTIKNIRSSEDPELKKQFKLSLPYFSGSLFQKSRCLKDIIQTNWIILDLDDVEDCDVYKAEAISALDPSLRFAFESPSSGLKLVFGTEFVIRDDATYQAVYSHLANTVEKELGVEVDRHAKSRAQACFYSHDPKLLENPNYRPFNTLNAIAEFKPGGVLQKAKNEKLNDSCNMRLENAVYSADCVNNALDSKDYAFTLDYETAKEAVIFLAAQGHIEYGYWIKAALALKARFGDLGRELFLLFADNLAYEDTRESLSRKWDSLGEPFRVKFESLFWVANKYGWYLNY